MLDTISQLESLGITDAVEVYIRGNTPSQPIKIYSNTTREFPNARLAVINGRANDEKVANEYFKTNFNINHKLLTNCEISEEKEILEQINILYQRKEEMNAEREKY